MLVSLYCAGKAVVHHSSGGEVTEEKGQRRRSETSYVYTYVAYVADTSHKSVGHRFGLGCWSIFSCHLSRALMSYSFTRWLPLFSIPRTLALLLPLLLPNQCLMGTLPNGQQSRCEGRSVYPLPCAHSL